MQPYLNTQTTFKPRDKVQAILNSATKYWKFYGQRKRNKNSDFKKIKGKKIALQMYPIEVITVSDVEQYML